MFGSLREEVFKFRGRCLEEFLTTKTENVVGGEVLKFEGGRICPISLFFPHSILWKNVWKFQGGGVEVSGKRC